MPPPGCVTAESAACFVAVANDNRTHQCTGASRTRLRPEDVRSHRPSKNLVLRLPSSPDINTPGAALTLDYLIGSTSLASMSIAIERMIRSTDTTTRRFPFLRDKMPCIPSSGPPLIRTRVPTFR
jgi:hypothetical protein